MSSFIFKDKSKTVLNPNALGSSSAKKKDQFIKDLKKPTASSGPVLTTSESIKKPIITYFKAKDLHLKFRTGNNSRKHIIKLNFSL